MFIRNHNFTKKPATLDGLITSFSLQFDLKLNDLLDSHCCLQVHMHLFVSQESNDHIIVIIKGPMVKLPNLKLCKWY